jgi:putative SOS response-associated peptidase YedK
MCGCVRLSSDVSEIKLVFSIPPHRPAPNFPPSWNVAPTGPLPVVRYDTKAAERSLDVMRWGSRLTGRRTSKSGSRTSTPRPRGSRIGRPSARRSDGAAALFRSITFTRIAGGKQPYAVALADRGLMALAGLWENWRSPAGEWMRSFAIVTTTPNELCAELHDRMPVVLGSEAWPAWLGEEPTEPRQLQAPSGTLSIRADDLLAGPHARRQRQKQ